ncbi:tyrosine--tRNA ligase [candidate division WWE3 bacterium]|nr:tyrosine--tRNA ligase [candidate division WWE3 bacterium]
MAKIDTDPKKIKELLTRGVHEVFTAEELEEKLLSGKQLHLKLGTDVTGPNLHLGHTVVHRKIGDFQELGHKVTLIIGDFTTLVGDHSDKVDMRMETSAEEIKKNEEHYKEQFFKTVLKEGTEIRHNSEWLKKLDFNDILNLTKQFTIAQMLERETFMLRYKEQKPIGLDEFMYPLMQGYDSVALDCDVEFGGTDQTFNLLAGRKLMPVFGQIPQSAVVTKLLTGSDGRPMGKSLKNFIPILDSPENMYGKLMSIVDEVIFEYFELVTRVSMDEITQMKTEVKNGANPMEFKKRLAKDVVNFYHGEKSAQEAQNHFEKTVQNKELPSEITIVEIAKNTPLLETLKLVLGETTSSGDIKRTVIQGGVEINGIKITDPNQLLENNSGDIIKFGKRFYAQIK